MSCPSGRIARSKLVLQTGSRLVRLLRSVNLSRASGHKAFVSCVHQPSEHIPRCGSSVERTFLLNNRRPNRWGCRLSTSCQVAASSPHAAVVETAEKKSSQQQGQLIALPTTDESPELDRIRHSVSADLEAVNLLWKLAHAELCRSVLANSSGLLAQPCSSLNSHQQYQQVEAQPSSTLCS